MSVRPLRLTPSRVRLVALGAAAFAAALFAYRLWVCTPPTDDDPPDPRLTFATPFRNVRPDVRYVGDDACAACHAAICTSYHQHPMGRSASAPAAAGPAASFPAFVGGAFRVEWAGGRPVHTEVLPGPAGGGPTETPVAVTAVIGSGTRGKSYLCDRDGSLWQSGVSWFAEKPGWDVSPGFWPGRHGRRPVGPECLYCHVNRADPVPGTANRYREPAFGTQWAIGCERCHGPGALHVAERAAGRTLAGGVDTSIVNPTRLSPELREDVCRQCHLQGETRLVRRGRGAFDYRPGLPLDQFLTIFVRHPALTDYQKSVGQVEQVAVSRCAAGSGGRFGCVSCHDPHAVPTDKVAHYRARCQACHADHGCSLPAAERQTAGDSCVGCHMPKAGSSNIAHTAVTDHRILRHPGADRRPKGAVPKGELPLTAFGRPPMWPDDPEAARDLAIVLARRPKPDHELTRAVADRLREATRRHRRDAEAWDALATLLLADEDTAGALEAADAAVRARPDLELALGHAAEAALRAGKPADARGYAERAVAINSGDPDHRLRLALAMMGEGKFVEAREELGALLAVTANHSQGRAALAVCLLKLGDGKGALAELDRAATINPVDGPAIRNWFSAHGR